jgi:CTP:molybdopterin cytidylyltransferase MocA
MPILAMAEAAMNAGKRNLALSVFAAADQPGIQREHLRELCVKLTGEMPASRSLRRVK